MVEYRISFKQHWCGLDWRVHRRRSFLGVWWWSFVARHISIENCQRTVTNIRKSEVLCP